MTARDEIAAERRRQIQIGCCSLELDSDGDWILWPPTDVTIFSAPGEGFLIGRCDEATARRDAEEYLAELGRLDRAAQEATDAP